MKVSPSQEAELNELQKKVAEMQKKIDAQNEELVELRGLNRDLQKELLVKIREGKSNWYIIYEVVAHTLGRRNIL